MKYEGVLRTATTTYNKYLIFIYLFSAETSRLKDNKLPDHMKIMLFYLVSIRQNNDGIENPMQR